MPERELNSHVSDDETTYNREAGILCRKCGYPTVPIYQGNALIGFYCERCNEDFVT